jgi:hypothetical protein
VTLAGATNVLKSRVNASWQKSTSSPEEACKHFVQLLIDKLEAFYTLYPNPPILAWGNVDWARDRIGAYLTQSTELYAAYQQVVDLDAAERDRLFIEAGGTGEWGGRVPETGFYCPVDGGLIGSTEIEAAQHGWRCAIDPEHHYGPGKRSA